MTSYKRIYTSTLHLPGLLLSVPLTPWQAMSTHVSTKDSPKLTGLVS